MTAVGTAEVMLQSAFVAEAAILDMFTGRLSAVNLLPTVAAEKFPALLPKMAAIGLYWSKAAGLSVTETVTVVAPSGEEVARSESRLEFTDPWHQSIHLLARTKLPAEGEYLVRWLVTDPENGAEILRTERVLLVKQNAGESEDQPSEVSEPS